LNMTYCLFVTDLHGKPDRYRKLFDTIKNEKPDAVFFGGDLLPHRMKKVETFERFTDDFLFPELWRLKENMKDKTPEMFVILGNDDAGSEEDSFIKQSQQGLFNYIHQKKVEWKGFTIFGYSFVPPSPFQLKDWEKYDVSRFVDPGCIPPTEGFRTKEPDEDIEYATIQKDLVDLAGNDDVSRAIFLFHSPPYQTYLDRARLDGKMIDHVPMDVNVGSIAIKRFIEERQPLITLHGHIHESTRLTGHWHQQIGNTYAFNAAHDGPELCIIKFNPAYITVSDKVII
jgi:Icc-related predicted phosphoesterase